MERWAGMCLEHVASRGTTPLLFFFPPHPLLKQNVALQNVGPEEILPFLEKEGSSELLL